MIDAEVSALFQTRDMAITDRDLKLFLSTQIGELPNSTFEGYVKIDKMQTDILSIFSEKETPYQKVIFARETYSPKDKDSFSWFLIFYLIDTKDGWKIYRVAY